MKFKVGDRVKNICNCGCANVVGQGTAIITEILLPNNYIIKFKNGVFGDEYNDRQIELLDIVPEDMFKL